MRQLNCFQVLSCWIKQIYILQEDHIMFQAVVLQTHRLPLSVKNCYNKLHIHKQLQSSSVVYVYLELFTQMYRAFIRDTVFMSHNFHSIHLLSSTTDQKVIESPSTCTTRSSGILRLNGDILR